MTDINDQLKRRANEAKINLELFEIIDKLGGLEQMELDLNQRIGTARESLTGIEAAITTQQNYLANLQAECTLAESKSRDIVASANQAADVIIQSAQDEADDSKAGATRSINLAKKAVDKLQEQHKSLIEALLTKSKELEETVARIAQAKADALKALS